MELGGESIMLYQEVLLQLRFSKVNIEEDGIFISRHKMLSNILIICEPKLD